MRVLIATWHASVVGGAEAYVKQVIPGLARRGHAVALLHERPAADGYARAAPAGLPAWCVASLGAPAALHAARRWGPDAVYIQGLLDPALEARLVSEHASALFAHSYYGTCPTGTKRHALPRVTACRRTLGPACLLLHYPRRCGGLNPLTMARDYRRQRRRRGLLDAYQAIFVASEHMRAEYARHGIGPDRLRLTPYPRTGAAPAAGPPERGGAGGRILFVGRVSDLKGVRQLIKAIPLVEQRLGRRVQLTVAGTGPDEAAVRALARRDGVVGEFPGWVSDAAMRDLLIQSDVLAVPSLWPEPFGLVGVEAAAQGVPAVAYDLGGIRDWLIPGETGELAPGDPPTVAGLADALCRVLEDPAHHARLSHGAWSRARRVTLDAHLDLVEPVLVGLRLAA